MFDVSHPGKGWTKLDPYMGSNIQSIDGYDQLFVKLIKSNRGGDDHGFLMFSCDREQPQTQSFSHFA